MYFERDPSCASKPSFCTYTFGGESLKFKTDKGVFSLGEVDKGSDTLLNALPSLHGRVLDLGCGYGVLGISIAKAFSVDVVMTDVNIRAIELSKFNVTENKARATVVESDGFEHLEGEFDFIVTNPPIRTGKEKMYGLFKECSLHIKENGALYMVIRKQQGAKSAMNYLSTLFCEVCVIEKNAGFWILECKNTLKGNDTNNV